MTTKMIVLLSIFALILGGAGFGFYMLNGVQNIKVDKSNEKPIATADGFDIPVHVLVTNPSRTTFKVDSVDYIGVLESTGEVLTRGKIENIEITKKASTWVNASAHVKWDKTLETTVELVKQDNVWVNVELDINFGPISIPYSTKIDIKEALMAQNPAGTLPPVIPAQNSSLVPNVL